MSGRWHFLTHWWTRLTSYHFILLEKYYMNYLISLLMEMQEIHLISYETFYSKYLQILEMPVFLWQKISKWMILCIFHIVSFFFFLSKWPKILLPFPLFRIENVRLVILLYLRKMRKLKESYRPFSSFIFITICVCVQILAQLLGNRFLRNCGSWSHLLIKLNYKTEWLWP